MSQAHLVKQPFPCHQLVEGALFSYLALVEYDDAVAMPDGAQTVGDDQTGAVQTVEIVTHLLLADVVERRGCLVEEEDAGVPHQGSGDEQTLLLAA